MAEQQTLISMIKVTSDNDIWRPNNVDFAEHIRRQASTVVLTDDTVDYRAVQKSNLYQNEAYRLVIDNYSGSDEEKEAQRTLYARVKELYTTDTRAAIELVENVLRTNNVSWSDAAGASAPSALPHTVSDDELDDMLEIRMIRLTPRFEQVLALYRSTGEISRIDIEEFSTCAHDGWGQKSFYKKVGDHLEEKTVSDISVKELGRFPGRAHQFQYFSLLNFEEQWKDRIIVMATLISMKN